jgi:esterase/lipase superfamily enzyme
LLIHYRIAACLILLLAASSPKIRGQQPPPVEASTPEAIYVQQIFYATNRRLTGRSDPGLLYGGEHAKRDQLHYGICEVSIPVQVHEKGREERPSVWKLQWRENPTEHLVLQSIRPMSRDRFLLTLSARLDSAKAAGARDAIIFIHGFNTTFENTRRRTAQIAL